MTTRRWVAAGVLLLAAGAIGWRLLGRRADVAESPATPAAGDGESGRSRAGDPAGAARGAIAGTVRDSAGAAIAGATVCGHAASDTLPDDQTRDPVCVASGANGGYRLTGLRAASYAVDASSPGLVPALHRDGSESWIRLGAGQERLGVDLVLQPGGALVTGMVVDIGGGPIEGAWVFARSWKTGAYAPTRSQADGSFRLWTAAGVAVLTAQADGYAGGQTQTSAPAETIDIVLTPESVLAGRVVEAGSGRAVPDAIVSIGAEDALFQALGPPAIDTAQTDGDGRFRLTRLSPRRYKPTASSARGYGEAPASVLLGLGQTVDDLVIEIHPAATVRGRVVASGAPCPSGSVTLLDQQEVHRRGAIADGQVAIHAVLPGTYRVAIDCHDGVSETSLPPLTVSVGAEPPEQTWTVRKGGRLRGTVRAADGSPVVSATVMAAPIDGEQVALGIRQTYTESDGTFLLEALRPGRHVLDVLAIDQPGLPEQTVVEVPDGAEASVELRVAQGGGVVGVVVDESGRPQTGLQVRGQPLAPSGQYGGGWTDAEGRFAMSGLLPGTYRITAAVRGTAADLPTPGRADGGLGVEVEVAAGQTANARLVVGSRSGVIRGRVVDQTGAAVTDAFVDAELESGALSAVGATEALRWTWMRTPALTDTEGRFALEKLAPGAYTVVAYRRGGGEAKAVNVAVGTSIALSFQPTASVSGTVKTSGAPLERFTVSLSNDVTGFARTESFYRTQGAFVFRDLPAGTFEMAVHAPEGTGQGTVTLTDGQARTDLTVDLAATATVTGRVVALDDDAPIANLTVHAKPIAGAQLPLALSSATTDAAGRFTVAIGSGGRVEISTFSMTAATSMYDSASRVVAVEPGRPNDIGDLRVPRQRVRPGDAAGDLGYQLNELAFLAEPGEERLTVGQVQPGGPAERAGLQVGDVITSVDGHDVRGKGSLYHSLTQVPPRTTVTLGVERGASVKITASAPP